jgi:hypothetical protein
MGEIQSFEKSEIGYSVTQHHIPEKQVYPPSLTAYEDLDPISQEKGYLSFASPVS